MSKSRILGVLVEESKVKNAAAKLGCLILKTPFLYLGTKVGGSMSRVLAWKVVVDKVMSRLSRWKMKTLSIGGRLTLVKSLGSMPIFHMSIFKIPSTVLKTLESIRSHFFNGIEFRSNKTLWVTWSNVLMTKEKGGLDVSSLFALNRGLMLKWIWRYYSQKSSLWTRVIKAIHGDDGSVGKNKLVSVRSCWMNIVHEAKELENLGVNIFNYIRLKVVNGESTLFWEEKWIDGLVLKDMFPRLYTLETNKKETVKVKMTGAGLDYSFRRKSSGEFSVASLRKVMDGKRFPGGISGTRWVKLVPIKLARKVSRWWNVGYSDVNSYDEWLKWIVSLRLTEVSKQRATKKQRIGKEVEELKAHLQIVRNDEDDVYTEATPLALKVLVVDFQIHHEHNKPFYKIIKADGTHQLFLSFITLLKNFDKEDLEMLWKLVQERFQSSEPKNFSNDFLLNTFKIMFEKPNVEANIWRE
nr:RNA-directed DNA polymerase, eukaryota [Tanacetum cinerariifolium]